MDLVFPGDVARYHKLDDEKELKSRGSAVVTTSAWNAAGRGSIHDKRHDIWLSTLREYGFLGDTKKPVCRFLQIC